MHTLAVGHSFIPCNELVPNNGFIWYIYIGLGLYLSTAGYQTEVTVYCVTIYNT